MVQIFRIILPIFILLPALFLHPEKTYAQAGDASQLIAEVNGLRSAYGLPPLKVNSALMSAAQKQSNYQAEIGSGTHDGPGGSSPRDRAVAAGYGGGAQVIISENIAAGVNLSTSAAVYQIWSDALHMETMISPYFTHVGAGVGQAGDWVYYTLVVGYLSGSPGSGPSSEVTPPTNEAELASAPTLIPAIPISVATPGTDGSIIHVVQPGQFLENIANAYDVSLVDLMTLNGFNEQTVIFPGEQVLIQPAQTPENPQGTVEIETEPEVELETAGTPTQTRTPTARPATSTPSPVPVAMNNPAQENQVPESSILSGKSTGGNEGSFDFLLYAVIALAFAGTALILFGNTLKKRS